jgi:hypothetical protein
MMARGLLCLREQLNFLRFIGGKTLDIAATDLIEHRIENAIEARLFHPRLTDGF